MTVDVAGLRGMVKDRTFRRHDKGGTRPRRCGDDGSRGWPTSYDLSIARAPGRTRTCDPLLRRYAGERLDALGPAPRAELLHVLHAPRLRAGQPDRRVLELPREPHFRRTSDRLRGGPDAPGGLVGMLREGDRESVKGPGLESSPAAAARTSRSANRVREAVRPIPLEMAVRPIAVGGSSGRY
jgi:hypothetical protein